MNEIPEHLKGTYVLHCKLKDCATDTKYPALCLFANKNDRGKQVTLRLDDIWEKLTDAERALVLGASLFQPCDHAADDVPVFRIGDTRVAVWLDGEIWVEMPRLPKFMDEPVDRTCTTGDI